MWTSNQYKPPGSAIFAGESTWFYLGMYFLLGLSMQCVLFMRTLLFATAGVRASKILHERVCWLLMIVPWSVFPHFLSSPLGRYSIWCVGMGGKAFKILHERVCRLLMESPSQSELQF